MTIVVVVESWQCPAATVAESWVLRVKDLTSRLGMDPGPPTQGLAQQTAHQQQPSGWPAIVQGA